MVIADIMKIRDEGDSPEGRNASSVDGFSPQPKQNTEESEKKLIDLEPMERYDSDEDDEEEEEEEENGGVDDEANPSILNATQPYSREEIESFINALKDFEDSLNETEISLITKLVKGFYLSACSTIETYLITKDKEETVDTLKSLTALIK